MPSWRPHERPVATVKVRGITGGLQSPILRQSVKLVRILVPLFVVVSIIVLVAFCVLRSTIARRQRRRQRRQQQQQQQLRQSGQLATQHTQMRTQAPNQSGESAQNRPAEPTVVVDMASSNSSVSASEPHQHPTSRNAPRGHNRIVRGFGPPPYLRALNRQSHARSTTPGATRTPNHPPAIIRIQRHIQSAAGLTLVELDAVAPETQFPEKLDSSPDHDASGAAPDDSDAEENENTDVYISQRMDSSHDVVCPVCLEDMRSNLNVRKLPCGHFFHSACIQEWTSKANRCPVCTLPVVDQQQLEKSRLAMLNGETVEPILSGSDLPSTRQRRRRTRGENGTFQLRDGFPSRIINPLATSPSTQTSETRDAARPNIPANDNINPGSTNSDASRPPATQNQRWTVEGRVASF